MPGGRPTSYKPEYCQMLIDHMATGLSYEAFAGVIGVSKQTIYDWEKANPQFLDAKSIGTEKCRVFWEKIATDHLINRDGESLNSSVWIFNMKNRFRWRDSVELNVAEDSAPLILKYNI